VTVRKPFSRLRSFLIVGAIDDGGRTSNVAVPGHWVKPVLRGHGLVAGRYKKIPANRGYPRRGSTKKHGGRVTLRPTSMPITLR
jgi:hypothetical protein